MIHVPIDNALVLHDMADHQFPHEHKVYQHWRYKNEELLISLEKGTMHACIVRFHKKKQVKQ
jgi:hypothetical protein